MQCSCGKCLIEYNDYSGKINALKYGILMFIPHLHYIFSCKNCFKVYKLKFMAIQINIYLPVAYVLSSHFLFLV